MTCNWKLKCKVTIYSFFRDNLNQIYQLLLSQFLKFKIEGRFFFPGLKGLANHCDIDCVTL
jgi:hypothetical protein